MELREVIGPEELRAVVAGIAARLDEDYRGKTPVFVGALKGAFIFMADLVRMMETPVEVEFIRASSYGDSCESSGMVCISDIGGTDLSGRDVVVVEDIVDTGLSLVAIRQAIEAKNPASVRTCALLDKPSRRRVEVVPDYVGVSVEDLFLVGYGLDMAERHRGLKGIYEVVGCP